MHIILEENVKIAILSDFHIGYERFREDAKRQSEEAIRAACSLADLIIIAGDIFDYRHPKPEVIAEAMGLFKDADFGKLSARVESFKGRGKKYTDAPIIAIPGTHERRTEGEFDSVDLLGLAGLLVNANQACVVLTKDGEKVAVYGVGGTAEERFKETLKRLDPKPSEGAFNIFVFHQSVYEFLPFSDDFIHLEELPEGFDLYIDGHIHSRIESTCHGKSFLIPGSTVLTQLKEGEQEDKGFFIYDTQSGAYTFQKINSRKFLMAKINVEGMDPAQVDSSIEKAIGGMTGKGFDQPIVRLVLEGRLKEGFKSIDIGTKKIAESHMGSIILEITKAGIEGRDSKESEELRSGMMDSISIRDYGFSLFMEKLARSKYNLGISPSKLFDVLSSEAKKEAVIKEALDLVFKQA